MDGARNVSGPKIIPESVIDLEEFIPNPRAIKRQLPLEPRILTASSRLDSPCVLRLQRRVNNAGIRAFGEFDHVVERGRLPTPTDINEGLCFRIDLVHRSELRIESPKILPMRLISFGVGHELIYEMALREDGLRSGQD